ncbi:hypothetical protein INT46_003830 [Mucor plumbeus]|uniref:Uncharacterized protein n=1 Tax=Mucor plumbeus TaxID=97098 RepID=A0A8H7RB60_9FUNG|nr:hypothetical protein INT46_003830 [Mucor plumbeus]
MNMLPALLSLKIYSIVELVAAASQRLSEYTKFSDYYNLDNWSTKLDFKSYIKKQKATVETAKRLFSNSIKYNSASTIGAKKPNIDNHVPISPRDVEVNLDATVIAFNSANFDSSYKRKLPALKKRITEATKQTPACVTNTTFVYINEYLTSQICNGCKQRQLENVKKRTSYQIRIVLRCESCKTA